MSTSVNNNGQACLVNKLPSYWVNEARTSHEYTDSDTQCIGVAISIGTAGSLMIGLPMVGSLIIGSLVASLNYWSQSRFYHA